jgi:hypothetical protein
MHIYYYPFSLSCLSERVIVKVRYFAELWEWELLKCLFVLSCLLHAFTFQFQLKCLINSETREVEIGYR